MEDTWAKKKKIVSEQEIIKRAKDIFEDFKQFTNGYRTLFLIQRHKEGGETHNSRLKKIITRDSTEYLAALTELLQEQMTSELPLRIYAAVNDRDFEKAIKKFKYEQLDADFFDEKSRHGFYLGIKDKFISCLMQPEQRKTNLFLFDCDKAEYEGKEIDIVGIMLQTIPNEHIIKQYKTKNGWHIITNPFNHTMYDYPTSVEMKKDGLILLAY